MGKLLDEDTVIKVLECWQKAFRENSHYVSASDLSLVIKDARELPPAQPERKRGEWSDGYRWQRCSLCKQTGKKSWNYCPNCGADMRGGQNG